MAEPPVPLAWLLAYVALLSLAALAACVWDKSRAVRGARRVPEATLLGLAIVGGSPGLAVGMLAVRHKTRKATFLLPFAAIVALQAAVLWWLFLR